MKKFEKIFDVICFSLSEISLVICIFYIYKHFIDGEDFWGYIIALIFCLISSKLFLNSILEKQVLDNEI